MTRPWGRVRFRVTRFFHALTSAIVLAALAIQTHVIVVEPVSPDLIAFPLGIRLWNLFSYFTIWSNLVVLMTSLWLVRDPQCSSPAFQVLRLSALSMISVTGLVYFTLLAHLWHPEGAQAIADYGLHYAAPLLTIGGWFWLGPHQRIDARIFRRSLAIPIVWVAYTFARAPFVQYEKDGELRRFYPYPFLDVGLIGAARVAMVLGAILFLYLGITWGFTALERKISRNQCPSSRGASTTPTLER